LFVCLFVCLFDSTQLDSTLLLLQTPTTTTTARHIVLNDDEIDAILSTAEDCSEHTQCGVDDVSGLVYELKEFLETLQERSENVNQMIADLEDMNAQPERKPDEVKAFVKDMLRVFETSDTSLGHYPIGFSGDIGDGPTTAYDSLPPKKWKKPETDK
jgi:hypothetical protein